VGESNIYRNVKIPPDTRPRRKNSKTTRPYVLLNMVESADGKTDIEGKASRLGTDIDRSVMRTLRSRADAVMVGGGTIRAERLSLGLDAGDTRPVPLAVILTNSGDLPLESNLVRDHRQDVLVLLAESADMSVERHLRRLAEIRRVPATGSGATDVASALQILKSECHIDILLCEGGPVLNQTLIIANLADELFATVAPVLVGANTPEEQRTFLRGQPGDPKLLRLISSHAVGDELFLRYAIQPHP
jgi:riboflavin-specific deaminase-like protein